jgi:hypothetical protein
MPPSGLRKVWANSLRSDRDRAVYHLVRGSIDKSFGQKYVEQIHPAVLCGFGYVFR